jgi:hypothetical protein
MLAVAARVRCRGRACQASGPRDSDRDWADIGGDRHELTNEGPSGENEIWLGDLDSNQDCSVQSREFYR